MKRRNIIIIIVLMLIGFASVSTTLILNGTIKIGESRFNVVFIEASTNGILNNSIITSDTSIKFDADFDTINEEYIVDYTVLNKSSNYAADITIDYTGDSSDYLSITNEFDTLTPLEAKRTRSGRIILKLLKPVTEDMTINISYELHASPVERDFTPIFEEEIAYLSNYEENLDEAINIIEKTTFAYQEMINISYTNYSYLLNNKDTLSLDNLNTINSNLEEINDISAKATYNGENLLNGSTTEPYKVELESAEVFLPVNNINTESLGLNNLANLSIDEAITAIDNARNDLFIKYNEIASVYETLNSLKSALNQKKLILYSATTDEEATDEIIKKSVFEILKNIRGLQDLTYSWIRNEGYYNNEIINDTSSSYINAINLIVETTNFKGIKLLDGTYKDIPNLSTEYLGLNDTKLIFDMSSKESVTLTRNHLEYAVNKLRNYTEEDNKYMDTIIPLKNEVYAVNDSISIIQNMEGELNEIHSILNRMNELQIKVLSNNSDEIDKNVLRLEQSQLLQEIDNIANRCMANNIYPLSGIKESITKEFGKHEETILLFDAHVINLGLGNFFEKSDEEKIQLIQNSTDIIGNERNRLGSLQNKYEYLSSNAQSILDVLHKNKNEEETKEELARQTASQILTVLSNIKNIYNQTIKGINIDKINLINEATVLINTIDIMVDDAQVNGVMLLDGSYKNIPSLHTAKLGYNDTTLTFKVSTESDIAATERSINYAIDKVKSIMSN